MYRCETVGMKFGFRKPSFKKSFAARTSWKRAVRHNLGLKAPRGWGWLTNPKKAAYNRVYNRTTFGLSDIFRASGSGKRRKSTPTVSVTPMSSAHAAATQGCALAALGIVLFCVVAAASSLAIAIGLTAVVGVAAGAISVHEQSQRKAFARIAAEAEAARLIELARQTEKQKRQAEEARALRFANLCERFGQPMADAIMRGKFWKGATFEMIHESLGPPAHSTERVLKTKTKATLYYRPITAKRYGLRIYFEHGRVVGWDDGNERVRSQ
jgi:hypothetical protein